MHSTRTRFRAAAILGTACAALLVAGPAAAATATYPDGGSAFSEGTEGWSAGGASCAPAELLCSSEAAYDAGAGNPPGSIAVKTTVTVNLADFFQGMARWNSPQFTVPVEAITGADVRLDRAFDPGGLVDVGPEATYAVTLADLTTGTSSVVLSEALGKEAAFGAAGAAPAAVVGGHTYRLSVAAETVQSTLAVSALTGTATVGFDNVGLLVRSAGSGGGGNDDRTGSNSSSGSLSDERLLSLLRSESSTGPAVLKGNRLVVKVACPAQARHACRITAQGLLAKRKPATAKRTVKLAAGKHKRITLRVRPRLRDKVAKRKRLLIREKVRAGTARATVYRQRRLIRQG